jgi:serine protease AprX
MAQIQAFLRLDPSRAPEQDAFLRSRVTILREAGGQFWVTMEDAQVDTFLSQGFVVTVSPEAGELQLGPVRYRPATETPQPPAAFRAPTPSGDDTAFWIVHFPAPVDKAWMQELSIAGADQIQTLEASAGVFRMTPAIAETVRAFVFVDSVALFHPAYIVGLDLAGVEEPFTAETLVNLSVTLPPASSEGNLQVRVFDGLNEEDIRAALEAAGATIVNGVPSGFLLQVAPEAASRVLSVPGLYAASAPSRKRVTNHNAGVILGVNQVRDIGTVNFLVNLDGQGEIGGIVDSGFDVGNLAGAVAPLTGAMTPFHPDLVNNMRLLRNSATPQNAALAVPDNDPHGTHVAGIVAGDGTSSPVATPGLTRGMAPRAAIVGLAPLPNDPTIAFTFAADNGARSINNSWETTVVVGFNNSRYTTTDALPVDRWCFDHPDVLILFAAGNDESDTAGGGNGVLDARTLGPEATGKNVLTVGASENLRNDGGFRDSYRAFFGPRYNNAAFNVSAGGAAGAFSMSDNANEIALFSDRGNVRTNGGANTSRIKPDVVAPGTNIMSTRSQWVAVPPPLPGPPPIPDPFYFNNFDSMLPPGLNRNLYQIFHGTSMATPMVTGSSLLVRQFYRTRFAQMRRPLLLEGVALPAAAPFPAFGNLPAMAAHVDGLVAAWITPALPGAQNNILAMRIGRHQAPVDAAPVHLQDNVGEHAAPKLATVGERTYLLHRHGDGKMRLSCFDRTLHLVPGFGTAGVVTLAPDARPDDAVPPQLIAVNDQLVCAFPTVGGNGYFFQRFRADTGAAVDGASISFLFHDGTGPHHALAWNGTRYAVCGVLHSGTYKLQTRQMDATAHIQGAGPTTILDQAAELREPCLIWDPRGSRYVLVWCDARTVPGGEIWLQFLDANAAGVGAPQLVITPGAAGHLRRPRLFAHPDGGYALFWEDDTQNGHFDVYVTFLDANGAVDGRFAQDASDAANRRLARLSDTPGDTAGFAAHGDAEGFVLTYQSPDEVNSDRLGIYGLNLTRGGAFEAQEDPSTPFQKSGRYVTVPLLDHDQTTLTALSAAWAGGSYYLLRLAPSVGLQDSLQWVRLHADGATDTTFGVNGILERPSPFLILSCETLWTGNDRLISVVNDVIAGITIHLHDALGAPVATFGAGGAALLQDTVTIHDRICPQVGFFTQPSFHVIVGYGTKQGGALHLRQQRVNDHGVRVGTASDLATADGVAAHNWYQFVNGESRSIAIYHRVTGGNTHVHCRRFQVDGTPEGPERTLSAAAGEATNGVVARRPTAINSTHREYGAAWQYRANNAAHWEIHFSRLDRQGAPRANPPAPAPPMPVSDITVISAATPGWTATRDAVEPQLVCTYTHEPWANPPSPLPAGTRLPEWSPAFGLAWIGVEADGSRILYFTVLDENGQRIAVPAPPPPAGPLAAPVQVGILQISASGARVQDFKLVWNGRIFFLSWVEEENGHLHQRATFVNRHANQIAYDIPSASLIRATIVNGATNITPGPLPDTAAGYGWGRLNLRQSLAPAPPVTLHVRDDCGIGPGRTITYHFTLPPGTALLRVTLNWTDPPGPRLVNHLHLTVRAPAPPGPGIQPEFRGNLWNTAAGQTHLSRPVANPPVAADNHEDIQTFKQVVLANPAPGIYTVEVSAAAFPSDPFNQQNLQPFSLVFAGTGPEVVFAQNLPAVAGAPVY